MRFWGTKQTPHTPVVPDVVLSLQMTVGTAQAFDYPAGTDLVRVTVGSSVAGQGVLYFNPNSTAAVLPTTSATATTATSGHSVPITPGEGRMYQLHGGSTGFGLVAPTSVQACVEFWSRAG